MLVTFNNEGRKSLRKIISTIVSALLISGMTVPAYAEEIQVIEEQSIPEEISDIQIPEVEMFGDVDSDIDITMDAEGIKAASGLNYFHAEADWVDDWEDARRYVDSKIDAGDEYICFWIYSNNNNESESLRIYMAMNGYCSFSAWGGCSLTSPHPNGNCMQFYTMDWAQNNLVGYAEDITATEEPGGIKITWTPAKRMKEQRLGVYVKGDNSGLLYMLDFSSAEYLFTKCREGKTYYFTIFSENDYGWSETDSIEFACTKTGKDYECNHKFSSKPTFSWSDDYSTCMASALCTVCDTNIYQECSVVKDSFKKATFSEDGYVTFDAYTNKFGGSHHDKKKIEYPKADIVKTVEKKYALTGSKCKPEVVVLDSNGNEISKDYYDVTYSCNNKPGKGVAYVTFKTGTSEYIPYCGAKSCNFEIGLAKPVISKKSAKSKGFKITFDKVYGAKSYVVEYSTSKKFTNKKTKTTSKNSLSVTKLKKNKKYYVRVRAVYSKYKSAYSDVVVIKTK